MHLIGRAGSDPQMKKIGEKDLATFSVAYSERYKDQDQTTWFNCEVWGHLANLVSTQLKKGDKITVIGKIQINQHEGKTYVKLLASEIIFL
jgi:single-strand DNA-binding protein